MGEERREGGGRKGEKTGWGEKGKENKRSLKYKDWFLAPEQNVTLEKDQHNKC